ncbi:D-hexose-6-phosphate mutarotase [Corynebacterium callunae]|uniref:aldose epimerase family protein n=1 Tax=Corynebacterium callunae TaxID=1721 RepID=UPI0039821B9A
MNTYFSTSNLKISAAGGHLTSANSPSGELLFLSSATEEGEGKAIRGGVPIIAPYFGTLLGIEPSHGWARRSIWEVTQAEAETESLHASISREGLALDVHAQELDDGFSISLRLTNTTDAVETVQLAFHPYFKVSNIGDAQVEGFDGVEVLDRLTDTTSTQVGAITFDGEFDRIALGTPTAIISDAKRTITITAQGHDSTVVWNPGEARAAELKDLGAGEWQDFVCVEPALLGADQQGVKVAPQESVTLEMTVRAN